MVPLFFIPSLVYVPSQVTEVSVSAEVTHHIKSGGPSYLFGCNTDEKKYRYKENIRRFIRKLIRELWGKECIE